MCRFTVACLTILCGSWLTGASAADFPRRPNILLIITDDQGYAELSCHGNPILKTPNIDRLHAQSLRFTDFQVSPTCSPTRASLMTGRHEFRSGVTHTIQERERLSLKATTIAHVLKSAGYSTGIFGKWHLGDESDRQPYHRGFDEVFIHGAGGIGQSYPGSCGDAPGNTYFDPMILHNGTFEKTKGFCTDVFFNQATRWIDAKRSESEPFFAYVATNAPHAPYNSPEVFAKPYRDAGLAADAAGYYGMIANIDENVGKLMNRLKDWKIENNTLVIFMTDNGHSIGRLYNAGMHGAKGTPYQGGTRVPSFWRLPGVIPAGIDVDQLTAHIDIFPTLTEIAGGKVPESVRLDGRSLVPLLKNPQANWADRYLFTHVGRWETGKASDAKFRQCSVRNRRFRLVNNKELYDLKTDPGESKNVIDAHPAVVAELRKAYDAWWSEVLPALENENVAIPRENSFLTLYRRQFGTVPETSPRKKSR